MNKPNSTRINIHSLIDAMKLTELSYRACVSDPRSLWIGVVASMTLVTKPSEEYMKNHSTAKKIKAKKKATTAYTEALRLDSKLFTFSFPLFARFRWDSDNVFADLLHGWDWMRLQSPSTKQTVFAFAFMFRKREGWRFYGVVRTDCRRYR